MPRWSIDGLQAERTDGTEVSVTEALLDVATNLASLNTTLSQLNHNLARLVCYTAALRLETKAIKDHLQGT